jgi:ATP-dependent DNA helicase RecQ
MRDLESILHEYWGYDGFRPLQREIIASVLEGRDTLAILPTGGGKSICFQVPALARSGLCLVVSPLIALMKDQVENLKRRNIPALLIHSGMSRADVVQTLKNAKHNYFKFLYLSPERLETSLFLEFLPSLNINLIAVDESHCVSQWGYDFRPAYLRIAALREELPEVPVLALTASATPAVQTDICEKLQLSTPALFRQSFSRPNLSYSVFQADSKQERLVHILKKVAGTAIVYCKSRRRAVEMASLLQLHGIPAAAYHAGLTSAERSLRQQQWISNTVRVMTCTNAFGMGIDKPDVRLVVHVDLPDCLENYYQEAGRAGRDGLKAYAVLLYSPRDTEELSQLHTVRYPELEKIREVYQALCNALQVPVHGGQDRSHTFHFDAFVRNFGLQGATALYALKALESDGWLDFNEKNLTPSTLVFSTNKQGLYAFEKSYPEHEPLLTTLLRTYEGIFDYPAFIQEKKIASLMRKEESAISQQLKTIASFGIIHYIPHVDAPQLILRKNRVPAENMPFNLLPYYKRRDAFLDRARQMISFVQSKGCRSQVISSYFGETDPPACGVCDNCLAQKAKTLSPEELKTLASRILEALGSEGLAPEELLQQVAGVRKEKAWQAIEYLQAENKIGLTERGRLVRL